MKLPLDALHPRTFVLPIAAGLLVATAESAARTIAAGTPAAGPPPAASRLMLQPRYRVLLESAWPAPAGETDACNNRASETLEGSLRRVAVNRYEGRFARQTRLGFCGTHGPAVETCGALLRGEGEVGVVGEITYGRDGRPTMSLVWQPVPGTTRTRLEGSCAPDFTQALERMYRDAVHSVDFVVPERPDRITLEDYGRIIEIR